MKILGIPDLLYMFPIFPAFLQNQSDRGEGWVGGPKILLCDKTIYIVYDMRVLSIDDIPGASYYEF